MSGEGVVAAIAAWKDLLGPGFVVEDLDALEAYQSNVTAFERSIPCVLLPASTSEVIEIVRIANLYTVPLYPISRGRNWGLGSRLPVRNGCAVVDLSRMNRILEVDEAQQVVVIEPGVTQQQLYDYLEEQDLPLVLNVTGSAGDTSLVGNCLERGVGYRESRADSLSGLEVVLGTGEVLRTGLSHFADASHVHINPLGLGPSLDGLFSQGNFGIVTKAGFRLLPKPTRQLGVICKLRSEDLLGPFVEKLRDLYLEGGLPCVVHIADQQRTESVLGPILEKVWIENRSDYSAKDLRLAVRKFMKDEKFGEWSAVIGLSGSVEMLRAAKRDVRKQLRPFCDFTFVTAGFLERIERLAPLLRLFPPLRNKLLLLPLMREMHGLLLGRPSDIGMPTLYWAAGVESPLGGGSYQPDQDECGFLYFLPFLPFTADATVQAVNMTHEVCAKHGCIPHLTMNVVNRQVMEAVISLSFRKSDADEAAVAHQAMKEVRAAFKGCGWYPYRVDIESMADYVQADDLFWQKVRDLKQVFDPNHIIAPGRYNLV